MNVKPRFIVFAIVALALFSATPNLLGGPAYGQTPAAPPAATLTITDAVTNTHALLPLNDWVPVFRIVMTYADETQPAPRKLETLTYTVKEDPSAKDRSYDVLVPLDLTDILEFALFHEKAAANGVLDSDDSPILVWDTSANTANGSLGTVSGGKFALNFVGTGTQDNPQFPVSNGAKGTENCSYIVAVRTSATWRNTESLAYDISLAKMYPYPENVDANGVRTPIDTYTPDLSKGGSFDPKTAYGSSFGVWYITGSLYEDFQPDFINAWNNPRKLYNPVGELTRPRWDAATPALDFVSGEFVQIRHLFPVETWVPVIGINLHGDIRYTTTLTDAKVRDAPLAEVNVVLTDIGGNPYGTPGNGGFNPITGLETFTGNAYSVGGHIVSNQAVNHDFAYNGVWVFQDTNNNGIFDLPTPRSDGGVQFTDYPMLPYGIYPWEYIPFPPGGGDPWWKIRLSLTGRSREDTENSYKGFVEPVPDGTKFASAAGSAFSASGTSEFSDYFVVVRADSGYADVSGLPGDGTGLTMGADFRAFIEPRRTNPVTGRGDGGIFVDSQIPAGTTWQDDPRWGTAEPWWPERTLNHQNAKPLRSGVEVHDLVLVYSSSNNYSKSTFLDYTGGLNDLGLGVGSDYQGDPVGELRPNFGVWMDPYGFLASQFHHYHDVAVSRWHLIIANVPDSTIGFRYPYETAPFFDPTHDVMPYGPRSSRFANPPAQPTLPTLATWSPALAPGKYPQESNWLPQYRQARHLKQHIESSSRATAMLGFNLVGTNDPVVNRLARLSLQRITVAFWGPEFAPSDLAALDPSGTNPNSGAALYEDTVRDGVFTDSYFGTGPGDSPIALSVLAWGTAPEYVDLDGDGIPDDLDGDGVVTAKDKAWVLRMLPRTAWPLPSLDASAGTTYKSMSETAQAGSEVVAAESGASGVAPGVVTKSAAAVGGTPIEGPGYWKKTPIHVEGDAALVAQQAQTLGGDPRKMIGPSGNSGDDLFLVVRTSDKVKSLEQFKVFVPATLPDRADNDKAAGIQFTPQTPTSASAYQKQHPEEEAVQPYYYNEMIESNVACKLTAVSSTAQISLAGTPLSVMGIDLSTNRPTSVLATGTAGTGGVTSFSVTGAGWTANAFVGAWLIDKRYEAYQITANTATQLTLLSGTPRNGDWYIVKNPTFLEQVVVEFYADSGAEQFKLFRDLKPLDIDQTVSGAALYRDNDFDTSNRNGVFDADVDIPLALDYAPFQIGLAGEPENQVMFSFSSPGTDDVPMRGAQAGLANQPRHRQWVLPTFGANSSDPNSGADFFVVLRAAANMVAGTQFRAAIVSWGPNTPTEPDPDAFAPPPYSQVGEFDVFSEFPWGERAIGLISFFDNAFPYYIQYPEKDLSGFNWVRSTVNKAAETVSITAVAGPVGPGPGVDEVVITSVTPTVLLATIPTGGLQLTITGSGFGTTPTVTLNTVAATINSATDTNIVCTIPAGTALVAPVVMTVTNPVTGKKATYINFTVTNEQAPVLTSVSPNSGTSAVFPVSIFGSNFVQPEVFFGLTSMPVKLATATRIDVDFVTGGLPATGPLDVTVRNKTSGLSAKLVGGFNYINQPSVVRPCFIATAAYGGPFGRHLDSFRAVRDGVLLKTSAGTAFVDAYYTISPAVADVVARHAWLAATVRGVLTPLAWIIESPWLLCGILPLVWLARLKRRKSLTAKG